jgi:hypothetical protein
MKAIKWSNDVYKYVVFVVLVSMSGVAYSQISDDGENVPMPVSINALMVTLIDHSAHYVWDYGAIAEERNLSADEWRIVEYYAIQLGASGPMITLGGTGALDNAWSATPDWIRYSNDLSEAAKVALAAAESNDRAALLNAGGMLVDTCEGCHDGFKPELPTEGFVHNPEYDHLYHLINSSE